MKCHLVPIAMLALCSVASAQTQSGSSVGESATSRSTEIWGRSTGRCDTLTNEERAQCLREQASIGTVPGSAFTRSGRPRAAHTSVGESAASRSAEISGRSTGRCDTLTNEERARCLREQASTGTAGGGSVGGASGTSR